MEIKVGVQYAPRELVVDVKDSVDELSAKVEKAIADGGLLKLEDAKGKIIIVPAEKLAYVEVEGKQGRPVGFAVS